jgi:hypothetical protein
VLDMLVNYAPRTAPHHEEFVGEARVRMVTFHRSSVGVLTAGVAALLLCGCTAASPTTQTGAPHAAIHATPRPTATGSPTPFDTDDPQDSGPRTGAEGTPILNGSGMVSGYTVAAGDTAGRICERFNVNPSWLDDSHGVPISPSLNEVIYAGEVITFYKPVRAAG